MGYPAAALDLTLLAKIFNEPVINQAAIERPVVTNGRLFSGEAVDGSKFSNGAMGGLSNCSTDESLNGTVDKQASSERRRLMIFMKDSKCRFLLQAGSDSWRYGNGEDDGNKTAR